MTNGRENPKINVRSFFSARIMHHSQTASELNRSSTQTKQKTSSLFDLTVTFKRLSSCATSSGSSAMRDFGATSGTTSPAPAEARAGPKRARVALQREPQNEFNRDQYERETVGQQADQSESSFFGS